VKKKIRTVEELRKTLEKVINGYHLAFFLPVAKIRNPTWEELKQAATDAYGTALKDVVDAIGGNTEPLLSATSEHGRLMVRDEDMDLLIERLGATMEDEDIGPESRD
jgi:hypothetical protein